MTGFGGWDGDMRNFPGLPSGGIPPNGDAACEALLDGHLPPADAEQGLRPLAEAIAALTMAPSARELAGEPDARAAYLARFGPARATRGRQRRIRLAASLLSVKLAAAAAVAAGGLTAAARGKPASHSQMTGQAGRAGRRDPGEHARMILARCPGTDAPAAR